MSSRLLEIAKNALSAIRAAQQPADTEEFVSGVVRNFRRSEMQTYRSRGKNNTGLYHYVYSLVYFYSTVDDCSIYAHLTSYPK
jgi:hypothetical protein